MKEGEWGGEKRGECSENKEKSGEQGGDGGVRGREKMVITWFFCAL